MAAELHYCEDCEMDGDQVVATEEWDTWGCDSGGLWLCKACAERRQDAYEPDLSGPTGAERRAHELDTAHRAKYGR